MPKIQVQLFRSRL